MNDIGRIWLLNSRIPSDLWDATYDEMTPKTGDSLRALLARYDELERENARLRKQVDDSGMPASFVIFTTQEGGVFQVRRATQGDYGKAADSKKWVDVSPFDVATTHDLVYIAFCPVVEDFNFVLDSSRMDSVAR